MERRVGPGSTRFLRPSFHLASGLGNPDRPLGVFIILRMLVFGSPCLSFKPVDAVLLTIRRQPSAGPDRALAFFEQREDENPCSYPGVLALLKTRKRAPSKRTARPGSAPGTHPRLPQAIIWSCGNPLSVVQNRSVYCARFGVQPNKGEESLMPTSQTKAGDRASCRLLLGRGVAIESSWSPSTVV